MYGVLPVTRCTKGLIFLRRLLHTGNMGESYYHVTMLITTEQEKAVKVLFEKNDWPCLIRVLSDETVTDIIDSGFTDIFLKHLEDPDEHIDETINTDVDNDAIDEEHNVTDEIEAESGSESSDTILMDSAFNSEKECAKMPAESEEETTVTDSIAKRQVQVRSARQTVGKRKETQSQRDARSSSEQKQHSRGYPRRRSAVRQFSKSVLKCIDCALKFQSRENLWNHRNEAKHLLPAQNIPTKYNLEVYSLEEHKEMGFIKCDGCDIYFLGKRRQMKHFYVCHRDLMPAPTCPVCCEEFKTYGELLKHKREEDHRDSLSSLNNYQCDLCGKHMTSYSNFVNHKQFVCGIGEKEMERIRIHACDICGKLYKSQRDVRRHKKISHFKVPEMCDVCGAVCQGRKSLDVHKKRHDVKNKKHSCSDCGKAFFSDSKLQEHIRTHTKEKPFKCPLCPYTCAVKPNIHKHATNVHKQAVVPIDLRKSLSAEKKTVSNTCMYADGDQKGNTSEVTQNCSENKTIVAAQALNRNMHESHVGTSDSRFTATAYIGSGLSIPVQGTSDLHLTNEQASNAFLGFDLNSNMPRHVESTSTMENRTTPNTYINSGLSENTHSNSHITLMSNAVPGSFADSELNRTIQGNSPTGLADEAMSNVFADNGLSRNIQGLSRPTQTTYSTPAYSRADYNDYIPQFRGTAFPVEKTSFQHQLE